MRDISPFLIHYLGVYERRPILYQPPCFMGFYESKCKKKLLSDCPKTIDFTGFFKKFCIATRTKKRDTHSGISFFGLLIERT